MISVIFSGAPEVTCTWGSAGHSAGIAVLAEECLWWSTGLAERLAPHKHLTHPSSEDQESQKEIITLEIVVYLR